MDHKDEPTTEHRRPDGVDDATVEALGKLSEALEVVEDARGHLYGFHRLTGMADLTLGEAVDQLPCRRARRARRPAETELVGRNVIEGRWTFQIVEEYDDDYYATLQAARVRGAHGPRGRAAPPLRGRDEGGPAHATAWPHHEAVPGGAAAAESAQNPET